MPYFLCPACALRAYSAAAECHCPSCARPLRRHDQLAASISHAEGVGGEHVIPDPPEPARFRRRARRRVPQEGLQ